MTVRPQSVAARQCTTQQTNYVRKVVNFNDALISAPTEPFARLPLNAFIVACIVQIVTAFNAATTNVLTFGTTTASANEIVAAGDIDESSATAQVVTRPLGTGLTAAAEVNLYAKYTQSGTAATAGKAIFTLQFIPDNDG